MAIRFVTRKIHAILIDYPVAASLMIAPFVLHLGQTNPTARYLSVIVGVAALVLPLLTDHETGVFRVLPYWFHVQVDRIVGVTFALAPLALGFHGIDALYYWANAAAVIAATVVFAAPNQPSLSDVAVTPA